MEGRVDDETGSERHRQAGPGDRAGAQRRGGPAVLADHRHEGPGGAARGGGLVPGLTVLAPAIVELLAAEDRYGLLRGLGMLPDPPIPF
ncbi:hypothetical protein AB0873_04280 [Micromonospora sp. NPDC047707]|uniref:hypothetical protein n=1 Tax=Micromonospora sp. NPDC047707 TaxID=3154498 RepID=UPI0034544EE2